MNKNIITEEGYQLIKRKLSELEQESKDIADKLSYARLDGDLSENADWIVLRENLEKSHDKVNKLRQLLESSELVKNDAHRTSDAVEVSSRVVYHIVSEDGENEGEKLEIEISSEIDSDPFIGKVSYQSPLGSALLGKKVGEIVSVSSSSAAYQIKVVSIK